MPIVPTILGRLGIGGPPPPPAPEDGVESALVDKTASGTSNDGTEPVFVTEADRQVAEITYHTIQKFGSLPSSSELSQPDVKQQILKEVKAQYIVPSRSDSSQLELLEAETISEPDFESIVEQTIEVVQQQTIDIPRIVVVPKGEVTTGFHPFTLDTSNINYQPGDRDLLLQSLKTNEQTALRTGTHVASEARLEDHLVRHLVDFPDVSYDEQADLLYELSGQIVRHLESYLDKDDAYNVLRAKEKSLADQIHAQMQAHRWEKSAGYDVRVTQGFSKLKEGAATNGEPERNFRQPPEVGERMRRLIFVGFQRCLYSKQKLDTAQERILAIILERESRKWFRPQLGQFQIYYKDGLEQREYQPDFVAETDDVIYMLEPKASDDMQNARVLAKREAAVEWCFHASQHALEHGGKPWQYILIPHDEIAENITLSFLVSQFGTSTG